MTPVFQRVTEHDPDRGIIGDCLTAALASLMDLPLSAVPHFGKHTWPDVDEMPKAVSRWLAERGYVLILTNCFDFQVNPFSFASGCHHLIFALCDDSRGGVVGHALIGFNGVVVHDPNPDKPVLIDAPQDRYFGFLVNTA